MRSGGAFPDRSVVLSISQFAELLALDPVRVNDVEVNPQTRMITIVQEPDSVNSRDSRGDCRASRESRSPDQREHGDASALRPAADDTAHRA